MTRKSTPVLPELRISGRDGSLTGPPIEALGIAELKVEFGESSAGRLIVRSLTVSHPEGITGALLRQLPIRGAERLKAAQLAQLEDFRHSQNLKVAITEIKKILAARPGKVAKHRNFPDDFFDQVALAYKSAIGLGDVAPSLTIARFTKTPLPTVKGWVRRTRQHGALPPARRGAAG